MVLANNFMGTTIAVMVVMLRSFRVQQRVLASFRFKLRNRGTSRTKGVLYIYSFSRQSIANRAIAEK